MESSYQEENHCFNTNRQKRYKSPFSRENLQTNLSQSYFNMLVLHGAFTNISRKWTTKKLGTLLCVSDKRLIYSSDCSLWLLSFTRFFFSFSLYLKIVFLLWDLLSLLKTRKLLKLTIQYNNWSLLKAERWHTF